MAINLKCCLNCENYDDFAKVCASEGNVLDPTNNFCEDFNMTLNKIGVLGWYKCRVCKEYHTTTLPGKDKISETEILFVFAQKEIKAE